MPSSKAIEKWSGTAFSWCCCSVFSHTTQWCETKVPCRRKSGIRYPMTRGTCPRATQTMERIFFLWATITIVSCVVFLSSTVLVNDIPIQYPQLRSLISVVNDPFAHAYFSIYPTYAGSSLTTRISISFPIVNQFMIKI